MEETLIFFSKINFIKFLDKLVGGILIRCLPTKSIRRQPPINYVLFIRPGGIGDAVLLIPSILALKAKYPEAVIDVLAERRNSSIFATCLFLRNVLNYDCPKHFFSVLNRTYDVIIDTEQWHRLSAVVARLTNAPMIIGFATNERKRLFTHPIAYSHQEYEQNSFLNLLAPLELCLKCKNDKLFLSLPSHVSEKTDLLLQPLASRRIVALFPGGSTGEKKWDNVKFHETAKMLVKRGYGVIIVGGKKDMIAGDTIRANLPHVLNFSGKLSLMETACALKAVDLIVTGDSGIMHIAYGLSKKIVALFGPGSIRKWAPRGDNVAVISKNLPCSPCTAFGYTPKCKINTECMKQIAVEEVYQAAIDLLER